MRASCQTLGARSRSAVPRELHTPPPHTHHPEREYSELNVQGAHPALNNTKPAGLAAGGLKERPELSTAPRLRGGTGLCAMGVALIAVRAIGTLVVGVPMLGIVPYMASEKLDGNLPE